LDHRKQSPFFLWLFVTSFMVYYLCQNFNNIPLWYVEKTEKQFNGAILLIINPAPHHGIFWAYAHAHTRTSKWQ